MTGGTGFVGSHLAEALLDRKVLVKAMVRSDLKWLKGSSVEPVTGDLFSEQALAEALKDVGAVYHVAGLTRARTQAELDEANVEGTRRLLEAVRQHAPGARVLITSSQAAAGPSPADGGPLQEGEPMRPLSMYGRSKAEMEKMVAEEFCDLDWTIVRPTSVYGPREADIYTIIRAASRGIFPIVGDGRRPALSLVHVQDLVQGMISAIEQPASRRETYFLGSDEGYTWNEIREAILDALGRRALKINVPVRLVGAVGALVESGGRILGRYPALNREKAREAAAIWIASNAKAFSHLDYRPSMPLDRGMVETVSWYRKNGWL